jgi:uncharacterized protein
MFDTPDKLLLGLFSGLIFGFLLQKGRVAKYHVIVGQLLLRDATVIKIMGAAIVVGAIGVYALVGAGWASLHVKPLLLGGILLGAVLFGIGLSVLGYCPGTSVTACGEGRRDAMVGVAGMLTGAAVFVFAFPALQPLIRAGGDHGKMTLASATDASPWLWITLLAVGLAVFAWLMERPWREWRRPAPRPGLPMNMPSGGDGLSRPV